MKITKKQLSKLIETFVVGPKGGAIDMGHHALKRSSHNLDSLLNSYADKIINHPLIQKRGYAEKLNPLLYSDNIKNKVSGFMLAKSLKIISKQEHDEIKKIVRDMKRLESAEDLKKNPPQGLAIGYPGKKVYRTEEGEMTDKKYAVAHAQRDDPRFESRLSQRIREIIPDLKTFVIGLYRNYGDPTVADFELINFIISQVTNMVNQRYGKIYSLGNISPAIKKILKNDFGIDELVSSMSSMREEYAEFLDLTDLSHDLDEILNEIYEDTPVADVLDELKTLGYDETFYKESFQDLNDNYVKADFDPNTYQEIMEYYIYDRINHEDHVNEIGISDGIIYRMR